METANRLALAYALLPGFGFWGPRGALRLELQVNQRLDRLCLFYESGQPEGYWFPGIWLYDAKGHEIKRRDVIQDAILSHAPQGRFGLREFILEKIGIRKRKKSETILTHAQAGRPIYSAVAQSPSLVVTLNEPTNISLVHLGNQPWKAGASHRHIGVKAYLEGQLVFAALNFTPQALVGAMQAVHDDLAIAVPDIEKEEDIADHVRTVQAALCAALEKGRIEWPAQRLGYFLPIYEDSHGLTPFSQRIIAEMIVRLMGKSASMSTAGLSPLRRLLATKKQLVSTIDEVNALLRRKEPTAPPVFASKHYIQKPALVANRDQYLHALDDAFAALEACKVQPMLAYGSLLGAVREGAFLQHDDDVDVIYFDGSRSRQEMLARRDELIKKLTAFGFERKDSVEIDNFHMVNKNAEVDFFPTWQERGQFFTIRRYPTYKPVPVSMVLPRSEVVLHGRRYPAPARPEDFLAWRYGPGWAQPDPYHEWPWPIATD